MTGARGMGVGVASIPEPVGVGVGVSVGGALCQTLEIGSELAERPVAGIPYMSSSVRSTR